VSESSRARVMVTNDDGIASAGLSALARVSIAAGLDVLVAAPEGEASGTSAALTATADGGRILIRRTELAGLPGVPAYAMSATPAFITFTAVRGAFGPSPRLLLSGINLGPNTGRAVLHSGTVGAAMTAAVSGVRAAAFSLDVRDPGAEPHWDTAAQVAGQVLPALPGLAPGVLLNVNIPNVSLAQFRGIRSAPMARHGAVQVAVVATTEEFLEVKMSESGEDPEPESDAALLAAGLASVTPVRPVSEGPLTVLPWPPATPAEARYPG
jgi:5'-nucleotidase